MMLALPLRPPHARRRGRAAVALAAFTIALLGSLPAAATSFGGSVGGPWPAGSIALSDLVSGAIQSFDSRNLKLTFSDFWLDYDGQAAPDVTGYRVLPIGNGFKLIAPRPGSPANGSDFDLRYAVDAADGLGISQVHIGLLGAAWRRQASILLDVLDPQSQELLAQLGVGNAPGSPVFCLPGRGNGGKRWDYARLDDLLASLLLDEHVSSGQGFFYDGGWAVSHRFKTVAVPVVPEPTTALLTGMGLLGLGLVRRRRA